MSKRSIRWKFIKIYIYFHIFSFFFQHDFVRYVDFTLIAASNIGNDESQIRSHIEYLIQTDHILMLIL